VASLHGQETGVLEVERSHSHVPWISAVASNTPLWSHILAKTGGFSWLGEANRLVCVTMS